MVIVETLDLQWYQKFSDQYKSQKTGSFRILGASKHLSEVTLSCLVCDQILAKDNNLALSEAETNR